MMITHIYQINKLPGSHRRVMAVSVLFAVKLYGGRGATFSINNSESTVIVAASFCYFTQQNIENRNG